MFGYITPLMSELKLKDYEKFRSYYCGLCISIKNKFGNIPRFGLNYDATFFAVLMDGLNLEETTSFKAKCIKHPTEYRTFIKTNKALDYATDLNMALIYYKLLDDYLDDNSLRSITLVKAVTPYYKKMTHNNINTIIKDNLNKLHSLEHSGNFSSLDEISHPFSHIMGQVLKECPFEIKNDGKEVRNNLYLFGYYFGKWIYLIDALDDLKKDLKDGSFNPISQVYNKNKDSYEDFIDIIKEKIDLILITLASSCSELIEKLPIIKNKEIIENVINLGLMDKYNHILLNL